LFYHLLFFSSSKKKFNLFEKVELTLKNKLVLFVGTFISGDPVHHFIRYLFEYDSKEQLTESVVKLKTRKRSVSHFGHNFIMLAKKPIFHGKTLTLKGALRYNRAKMKTKGVLL